MQSPRVEDKKEEGEKGAEKGAKGAEEKGTAKYMKLNKIKLKYTLNLIKLNWVTCC